MNQTRQQIYQNIIYTESLIIHYQRSLYNQNTTTGNKKLAYYIKGHKLYLSILKNDYDKFNL